MYNFIKGSDKKRTVFVSERVISSTEIPPTTDDNNLSLLYKLGNIEHFVWDPKNWAPLATESK